MSDDLHLVVPGVAATAPAGEVPTGFSGMNDQLDRYFTAYWNKQARATHPGELAYAEVTKWLHMDGIYVTGVPHSIKRPGENRVWYQYPDQTYITVRGRLVTPSKVGRVLDDGTSQIWESTYNTPGSLTSQKDPLGRQATYTYAANGIDLLEVRQTTGGANDLLATFSSYTAQHRPQTVTDAAGQTTTITYNAASQPLTVTNPKSETTTFVYDSDGRLTSVTGPVTGTTATFTYDGYGRARTSTSIDGDTVTVDYDLLDRPTQITYPDLTTEKITYDRLDAVTTTDRRGRVTRTFHDPNRRVTRVRDPLGRMVEQKWSLAGLLTALVDGKGQSTTWTYDAKGRVVQEVRGGSATTAYTYETTTNRLKTVTDPKGQVTTFTYAIDDALLTRVYTNEAGPTADVTFTYDTVYPRLATMVDGIGTTAYSYTAVGQPGAGAVSSIDGPRTNDTLTYTYDELGRVLSRVLNAVSVSWAFDSLGRTTSEVNPLGTFGVTYDGVTGRVASVSYPNGQTSTYSYLGSAGERRLQTIHHKTPSATMLSRFDYTYGPGREHPDLDAAGGCGGAGAVDVRLRRRRSADQRGQTHDRRVADGAGELRLSLRHRWQPHGGASGRRGHRRYARCREPAVDAYAGGGPQGGRPGERSVARHRRWRSRRCRRGQRLCRPEATGQRHEYVHRGGHGHGGQHHNKELRGRSRRRQSDVHLRCQWQHHVGRDADVRVGRRGPAAGRGPRDAPQRVQLRRRQPADPHRRERERHDGPRCGAVLGGHRDH